MVLCRSCLSLVGPFCIDAWLDRWISTQRPLVTREVRKSLIFPSYCQANFNIAHSRPLPSPALQRLWLAHINYIVHAIVFRGSWKLKWLALNHSTHAALIPKIISWKESLVFISFFFRATKGKRNPTEFTLRTEKKAEIMYVCIELHGSKVNIIQVMPQGIYN